MIRVLVTGSSGFVGSAICEALVERGCAVVGFDRVPSKFSGFDCVDALTFVAGDIRDSQALQELFTTQAITHVVHTAAMTPDAEHEKAAPDKIIEINMLGACRLMQAAAKHKPQRILYLSSISAYGNATPDANGHFSEEATYLQPSALYGISKFACEMVLRRIAELSDQDLRIVRLGPLFGPWEHASGTRDILSPHHQIVEIARNGRPCILPRAVPADWLYSRDGACRIIDLLLADDLSDEIFNLGGGAITTLIDWCEALRAVYPGFNWSIDPRAPTVRYGYTSDRPALNNARIDASCPFSATPLADAVRETLSWLDRVKHSSSDPEHKA